MTSSTTSFLTQTTIDSTQSSAYFTGPTITPSAESGTSEGSVTEITSKNGQHLFMGAIAATTDISTIGKTEFYTSESTQKISTGVVTHSTVKTSSKITVTRRSTTTTSNVLTTETSNGSLSTEDTSSSGSNAAVIGGALAAVFVVILLTAVIVVIVVCVRRRKQKQRTDEEVVPKRPTKRIRKTSSPPVRPLPGITTIRIQDHLNTRPSIDTHRNSQGDDKNPIYENWEIDKIVKSERQRKISQSSPSGSTYIDEVSIAPASQTAHINPQDEVTNSAINNKHSKVSYVNLENLNKPDGYMNDNQSHLHVDAESSQSEPPFPLSHKPQYQGEPQHYTTPIPNQYKPSYAMLPDISEFTKKQKTQKTNVGKNNSMELSNNSGNIPVNSHTSPIFAIGPPVYNSPDNIKDSAACHTRNLLQESVPHTTTNEELTLPPPRACNPSMQENKHYVNVEDYKNLPNRKSYVNVPKYDEPKGHMHSNSLPGLNFPCTEYQARDNANNSSKENHEREQVSSKPVLPKKPNQINKDNVQSNEKPLIRKKPDDTYKMSNFRAALPDEPDLDQRVSNDDKRYS